MRRLVPLMVMFGLLFTACQVTVTPNPDPDFVDTEDVSANRDPETAVDTYALDIGESVVYQITISASAKSDRDLLYIELSEDLQLEVFGSNDEDDVLASSQSSAFFAEGSAGLSSVAAQGIGSTRSCGGSCAILKLSEAGSQVFVRVSNQTDSGETFDLYVFSAVYGDTDEPDNNERDTAPTVTDTGLGVLETLGDTDFFEVGVSGEVDFTDTDTALDIQMDVLDSDGSFKATVEPGGSGSVSAGDFLRIRSGNGRAAAPGSSNYGFEINETSTFPDTRPVTANRDGSDPVDSVSLDSDEAVIFEVTVPGSVESGRDLLYVEISEDLEFGVYDSGGTIIASSASSDFFAEGLAAVNSVSAQQIGVLECRGSCVLLELPISGGRVFARVLNQTSISRSFDLYAYSETYADASEPENDDVSTAPVVTTGGQGFLETLGDIDYYAVGDDGTLEFVTAPGALNVVIEVVNLSGDVVETLRLGDSYDVINTDVLRVRSTNDRAGAPGASSYGFEIN